MHHTPIHYKASQVQSYKLITQWANFISEIGNNFKENDTTSAKSPIN